MSAFKIPEKKTGFRKFFSKLQKTDVFLTFWGNWGSDDAKIFPKTRQNFTKRLQKFKVSIFSLAPSLTCRQNNATISND